MGDAADDLYDQYVCNAEWEDPFYTGEYTQERQEMSRVVAFVQKVNSKSGTGRNGKPYTLYSMKLMDKSGEELDGWFQCAFDKPTCNEGDYIQVEVKPNGSNFDADVSSIKISKNPPARPKPANESGSGGGGAKVKSSDLFGEIGGYNTEDDIRRMSYSAARDAALKTAELLLEHGGLKLVAADTKAGAASRFDVITSAIDKLTVEYFFDAATGRKLDTVADAGVVNVEGDGPLPAQEDESDEFGEPPEDDGFADEGEDGEFE